MDRTAILSSDDTVYRSVEVPEWGGTVWVRNIYSTDRDEFEESMIVKKKVLKNGRVKTQQSTSIANLRAKLVVRCVCQGQGQPELVFTPEDADILAKKNARIIDLVYTVAAELSGFSDTDIEELAGN